MEEFQKSDKTPKFISFMWTVLFTLMYPIITTFSLIFTGIVAVSSLISRFFVYIFTLGKKK